MLPRSFCFCERNQCYYSWVAKTRVPVKVAERECIKGLSQVVDREILVQGRVTAAAVKGAAGVALARGLRVVEGVGIVLTAYDLKQAGVKSYRQGSARPLAAESVRQAGGWAWVWWV